MEPQQNLSREERRRRHERQRSIDILRRALLDIHRAKLAQPERLREIAWNALEGTAW